MGIPNILGAVKWDDPWDDPWDFVLMLLASWDVSWYIPWAQFVGPLGRPSSHGIYPISHPMWCPWDVAHSMGYPMGHCISRSWEVVHPMRSQTPHGMWLVVVHLMVYPMIHYIPCPWGAVHPIGSHTSRRTSPYIPWDVPHEEWWDGPRWIMRWPMACRSSREINCIRRSTIQLISCSIVR